MSDIEYDFEDGQIPDTFSISDHVFVSDRSGAYAVLDAPTEGTQFLVLDGAAEGNSTRFVEFTHTWLDGGGTFLFDYAVRSERSYDRLNVYLDGTRVTFASGTTNTGWTYQGFGVEVGDHVVRFEYKKDETGDNDLDAAFIDHIVLTNVLAPTGGGGSPGGGGGGIDPHTLRRGSIVRRNGGTYLLLVDPPTTQAPGTGPDWGIIAEPPTNVDDMPSLTLLFENALI